MTTIKQLPDFTRGSIPKQLITFATPLFLSSLLQIVYNMVDMVVVGQKLGQVGLSAVSVGGDISHFLTFLAMGFSNAGQIIISQHVGVGKREEIGKIISTLFPVLLATAACFSTVALIFRESLYYRVVVISVPLQGHVLHCRGCCGLVSHSYRKTVSERLQPQPFTGLLIS